MNVCTYCTTVLAARYIIQERERLDVAGLCQLAQAVSISFFPVHFYSVTLPVVSFHPRLCPGPAATWCSRKCDISDFGGSWGDQGPTFMA